MKRNQKYSLKRRRYGWGWIPVTWQGWLFLLLQLVIILVAALQMPSKPAYPSASQLINFFATVGLVILSMILVGTMMGPKPHWRWGKKPSDDPNEDF